MIPWETIGIGAVGAIFGGTIVTLFGPLLQPAASYLNKNIWAASGRFNPPEPDAYTLTRTENKFGSFPNSFPEMSWKESYELVELYLQNTEQRPLTDVQGFLSFDGVVVNSTITDASYGGVEITPISDGGAGRRNNSKSEGVPSGHGAMTVFVERLPPRQSVRAKFVIETCPTDVESNVRPRSEDSFVSYRWEFHDVMYGGRQLIEERLNDT